MRKGILNLCEENSVPGRPRAAFGCTWGRENVPPALLHRDYHSRTPSWQWARLSPQLPDSPPFRDEQRGSPTDACAALPSETPGPCGLTLGSLVWANTPTSCPGREAPTGQSPWLDSCPHPTLPPRARCSRVRPPEPHLGRCCFWPVTRVRLL